MGWREGHGLQVRSGSAAPVAHARGVAAERQGLCRHLVEHHAKREQVAMRCAASFGGFRHSSHEPNQLLQTFLTAQFLFVWHELCQVITKKWPNGHPCTTAKKHLNIPFCDLSISGYSEKNADAAPYHYSGAARTLRAQLGLTAQLLHIPRPCSGSTVQKRPRSETSWFAMESNRVRNCSTEYPWVLGSIHRTANSQPVEHNPRQCPTG